MKSEKCQDCSNINISRFPVIRLEHFQNDVYLFYLVVIIALYERDEKNIKYRPLEYTAVSGSEETKRWLRETF